MSSSISDATEPSVDTTSVFVVIEAGNGFYIWRRVYALAFVSCGACPQMCALS